MDFHKVLDKLARRSAGRIQGQPSRASLDTTNSSSMNTVTTQDTAGQATSSLAEADCPFLGHPRYAPLQELHRAPSALAQTYLARQRDTGAVVAVKLLDRGAGVTPHVGRELAVHRRCAGHPFVAQLLDVFLSRTHLAIVLEYAPGGDLRRLVDARGGLPEDEARHYFQQVVVALSFLHSVGSGARDVKLENKLLVEEEGGEHGQRGEPRWPTVKVQDFTYSKSEQYNSDPHSALATLPYAPPEVLSAMLVDVERANVWSLGVMLLKMITCRFPFEREGDGADPGGAVPRVLARIAAADFALPPGLSPELRDMLSRMIVLEPAGRLPLAGVVACPWFQKDLPPGLLEINARLLARGGAPCGGAANGAAACPPSEAEIAAVVAEAQVPLRRLDSGDIDLLADEILDEEVVDEFLEELSLEAQPGADAQPP